MERLFFIDFLLCHIKLFIVYYEALLFPYLSLTPLLHNYFSKSNPQPFLLLPAEDSAQQRGIEALGRREASLHLADRHLVLGGGAEEREATGHRTEDLGRVGHHAHAQALLAHGQRREGRAVEFGRDGDCGKETEVGRRQVRVWNRVDVWLGGGGENDNMYTQESR